MTKIDLEDDEIEYIVSSSIGDIGFLEDLLQKAKTGAKGIDVDKTNKSIGVARRVVEKMAPHRRGGTIVAATNSSTK